MVQMHVKPTDSYEFAAWFDIPMKPLDEITWADVLGCFVLSSTLLSCHRCLKAMNGGNTSPVLSSFKYLLSILRSLCTLEGEQGDSVSRHEL